MIPPSAPVAARRPSTSAAASKLAAPAPAPAPAPASAPADASAQPSLLAAITADVAGGADLGALLQRFLEPIVHLAGAQAGAVRVLSTDGQRLELVGTLNLPALFLGAEQTVDRHCGHCGSAADGQALVWASEPHECVRRSGVDFLGGDCRHLLAVPLRHRGRVHGLYNLFFTSAERPPAAVQALLQSIGDLLGLALNNARLEAEQVRTRLAAQRQQMAAEVHDSLAQSLAFVKMRLAVLEDALQTAELERARGYCRELREAATQAHASLRGILTQLRAPVGAQGLEQALQRCVEHFRRHTGGVLDYRNELPGLRLAPERETEVFHVVQEALANVARHAGADHAWLQVAATAADEVQVTVDDDGIGPAGAGRVGNAHYGLEIMRERARRLGGRLALQPRAGGGTRVQLSFPLAVEPRR